VRLKPCCSSGCSKAGCGKSTAITLVQRFYDPVQGSISLDGFPLQSYDLHHLRAHTGVVAQDNILFSATLRENITYGMGAGNGLPVATDAMVVAACAAANASEFIAEFPNGLSTLVGEKGVKLSGGQKQRIAIARAIIRSPPILLLDEATSALDSVNEREVQKALDEMLQMHKGVALVIAHRLTTIKNCDQIVVIDRGKKVEQGTHPELLKLECTFANDAPGTDDTGDEVTKGSNANGSGDETAERGAITGGYYRQMWETQMGEETKSLSIGSASATEIADRLALFDAEMQQLHEERGRWEKRRAALAAQQQS
jgi:ABC-type methionine transport system ATPase subunit